MVWGVLSTDCATGQWPADLGWERGEREHLSGQVRGKRSSASPNVRGAWSCPPWGLEQALCQSWVCMRSCLMAWVHFAPSNVQEMKPRDRSSVTPTCIPYRHSCNQLGTLLSVPGAGLCKMLSPNGGRRPSASAWLLVGSSPRCTVTRPAFPCGCLSVGSAAGVAQC